MVVGVHGSLIKLGILSPELVAACEEVKIAANPRCNQYLVAQAKFAWGFSKRCLLESETVALVIK